MHPDRIRVGKLVLRDVALLVCGLSVGAVCPAVGFASDVPNWSAGVEVQLPAGAATDPLVSLGSVSCASPGNCSAVGEYNDSSDIQQGLLLSQSAGGPAQAVEAQLPAAAASDPNVFINSVSCASAGDCAAVGHYTIGSQGEVDVLLFSESGGVWATGTQAQLPAGALPGALLGVDAHSVTCESAGNCTAVGSYLDAMAHEQGLLLSESGGVWATGIEAQLPTDAAMSPGGVLVSVSCTGVGNCVAVGSYSDATGRRQALLLSESAGVWAAGVKVSLPADANANPAASLGSVSCASTGNCTAVGGYTDSSGARQGLLVSESGGVWGTGLQAPLPPGAGTDPSVIISSVSCASAGDCAAVGGYNDNAPSPQGLLLSQSGGAWSTDEAAVPAGGLGTVSLNSVSCPSAGDCAAGGAYIDSLPSPQGLLLSESGGVWATGVEPQPPAGAAPYPGPQIFVTRVSCASVGACTAVGGYFDAADTHQALLLTATPAAPALTLAAPAIGGVGRELGAASLTATLTGGTSPTGSASFKVFGPQPLPPASCTSGGIVVGTAPVSGNGDYHPPTGFTPTAAGNYWWYASYGGDTSDLATGSPCGPSMAETTVEAAPSIALTAPASGFIGVAVRPSALAATVAGGASPAGPLSFRVFGPQAAPPASCASGGRLVSSAGIAGDGVYHPATGFTPRTVGDYWWYASYGGDTRNLAAASGCGASMAETAVGLVRVGRARVAGNSAIVVVRCVAIVACRVTLSLTATETTRGAHVIAVGRRAISGARGQPRKRRLVVLRSTTVLIRAGRHRTVALVLDSAGGRLLARFGHLRARLTVKQPGRTWSIQTVTFDRHKPRGPHN